MRRILTAAIFLLTPTLGFAQDNGCDKFAWSIARERAWFGAPEKSKVAAGDTLSTIPAGALIVKLSPAQDAKFTLPPERKSKSDHWFGGAIYFPAIDRAGIFQVTLSEEAWLDVSQNGRYARSVESTGRSDCPGMRKSVRLELAPGPIIVQLSGVASDTVTLAIAPRE